MKYRFHPAAIDEFQEAASYYHAHNSQLSARYIAAVEDAISRIVEAPRRWPVIDEDVRRCRTRVFPYGILYTLESDHVLILAVMHSSREPGTWKKRTPNPP